MALLRAGTCTSEVYAGLIDDGADPSQLLDQAVRGDEDGQRNLLAPPDPSALVEQAREQIVEWERQGMTLLSTADPSYPVNLRAVHDRPLLIFVAGQLDVADARSIALIGSRRATDAGLERARSLARSLSGEGFTVISGLAAGIDTAAHTATLDAARRTVAVVGTGLLHAYPPENAGLQRQIAACGAVVSRFWPEASATRGSFPLRNATMSGLALGTVIVEASVRSGARIQARLALAHGRPVFLAAELLGQDWAAALAERPGVSTFAAAEEIIDRLERLHAGPDLSR